MGPIVGHLYGGVGNSGALRVDDRASELAGDLLSGLPVLGLVQGPGEVAELVALAKASPGKLTYGHSGLGTSPHLAGEVFNYMAHIDVQQVPFRGSSLIVTDLMGGRITMSFIPPTASLSPA